MNKYTRGALAGFLASGPMTYALMSLFKKLDAPEKSPLPPATITNDVFKLMNLQLGKKAIVPATMTAHFGYGTVMAIPYSMFFSKLPVPKVVKGSAFGLAVWGASYLGLNPMLGLRSQASRMPWRRNAMMIGAHIVWGTGVAYADSLLRNEGNKMLEGQRKAAAAE